MSSDYFIRVDKDCPYLDMKNLTCTYKEDQDRGKKYRATPKCITCKIALYELWKERQMENKIKSQVIWR